MARIHEIDMADFVQDHEKHDGVAADLGVFSEKAVDEIEDTRGIIANGHAEESALEHGSEKRGAETLAGNIRDQESRPFIVHRENGVVVAANGEARRVAPGHGDVREITKPVGKKR